MVTYVILGSYTEQGIRNIKQLPQLRQAAERRMLSFMPSVEPDGNGSR